MSSDPARKGSVKQRLEHEMKEYLVIAAYLAAFFVSFTTYRKLVLAEYHVGYFAYGWALMEAMILAKVILIGQFARSSCPRCGSPSCSACSSPSSWSSSTS
jgi:hypothetical protein